IPSIINGQSSNVKLVIYNATGKEIRTLVNEKQNAGSYTAIFDGAGLSSGVYYYTLVSGSPREAGNFTETKKMLLLK
ncbi:MAG TPA: FlgD immunoglobulin-like domain containing protein, partial [Ignavibacteria bacterium]|nr:FlgD immunoglobulin-like domain containing protein [Ignavibacteria bacterium]